MNIMIDSMGNKERRKRLRLAFFAGLLAISLAAGAWSLFDSGEAISAQQVKEFTLTAEEIDWELQPGTIVKAWAYNGQVPGPEIRVTEGDLVRIHFENRLPVASTIHFHGVNVPQEMDGPAGLNQAAVEPGESFTYEFVATPSGTRWFHSHTDVATQVMLGLYGSFIVEPKSPQVAFDREYTYVLSEWDLELTPEVAMGLEPRGPRDSQLRGGEFGADLFLFNGKMHDGIAPMLVEEGDRVLIRLINAGTMAHPFHTHGHSFRVVGTDGNLVPEAAQIVKDTIMIAPGERYDLLLVADNPGVWMVHCHIENHADNGMMTVIQYRGVMPSGPIAENWNPKTGGLAVPSKDPSMGMGHALHHAADPASGASETPSAEAPVPAGEAVVALADNRYVPGGITVTAGTTVTFQNTGGNWHSVKGNGGAIDSGSIESGGDWSYTFDEPGVFKLICIQHIRQGMSGEVIVVAADE
ncbi:MAG: multicopper oxidase domain-containing protein [Thermomicrobiales bacterium]|nr:multicopper oxidase domain-containing protein [Thermomicrobiales bacterium]